MKTLDEKETERLEIGLGNGNVGEEDRGFGYENNG